MAAKNEKSESPAQKPVATEADAPRYTKERLLEDANLIVGYPKHVVAGALVASSGTSWTAEQAKDAVEKFLNKEAK